MDILLAILLLLIVFFLLYSKWFKRTSNEVAPAKADYALSQRKENYLRNLDSEIVKHLSDPSFSVDVVSKNLGVSTRQLRRKVKEATEMTLISYIQDVRLHHAMRLLTEKKVDSVKSLCETIGTRDRKYFSKSFKTKFGKSPAEFLNYLGYFLVFTLHGRFFYV